MSDDNNNLHPPDDQQEVGRLEYETRVLYSMLGPAIRFAHQCHIPLDRVTEMASLGYLSSLRQTGMTLREASDVLGKSLRTVNSISKRLRQDFFAPEQEHGLPRRIEFHLTSSALTVDQLLERLGSGGTAGSSEVLRPHVEQALAVLVSEERIRLVEGATDTYELAQPYANLVRRNLARRIDGLNDLSDAVLATVMERFFTQNDTTAFARTITFAAPEEGLVELRQRLYDTLRLGASDLEEEAQEQGQGDQKYSVVLCTTPLRPGGKR